MKNIKETTVENIKALRNKLGMTQEEFAAKVDISIPGLQSIEYGKNIPTIETLWKISQGLNVRISQLVGEVPLEEPPQEEKLSSENEELKQILLNTANNFNVIYNSFENLVSDFKDVSVQKMIKSFVVASEKDKDIVMCILLKNFDSFKKHNIDKNDPIKIFCESEDRRKKRIALAEEVKQLEKLNQESLISKKPIKKANKL